MRPTLESPPAVVLSGNLGTPSPRPALNEIALALTKSLGRHGVEVFRFHPDQSLLDLSSRYSQHVSCPNIYDDPEGLARFLVEFSKRATSKPVLFPASDGASRFIADHENDLRDHFLLTSPGATVLQLTQDKRQLIEAASEFGIPVPKTWFPETAQDLMGIALDAVYPVIIKPTYPPDWKRKSIIDIIGFKKALEVENAGELSEYGRQLLGENSSIMVQEIVPGPTANLVTFLGCMDGNGELIAGCTRAKRRQYPDGFGYCSATDSIVDEEITELSRQLLRALNYQGIACVEFKRDARDGAPKLIEVNCRAVRTSMLAIASGVDFPWLSYKSLVWPSCVTPAIGPEREIRWIHLYDDLRAVFDGQVSFTSWVYQLFERRVVLAEFSWDDVWPGILLWKQMPGHAWRKVKSTSKKYLSSGESNTKLLAKSR